MMSDHKVPFVSPELFLRRRVAIVGASGNLLDSKLGAQIDSYDEVIRFNRSPTDGYEEDVGTKTTLRIVNNHVFNNNDISKEGYSDSPPNFVRNLRNSRILYVAPDLGPWYNRDNNCHESNAAFLFDYYNVGSLKKTFEYRDDSNFQVGTIAILLCIAAGIKPDLFGFDLEPLPRTHYYQDRPKNCSACHNVTEEQKLIIKLRDDNFLNIIKSV
jgi:hypothetical protein